MFFNLKKAKMRKITPKVTNPELSGELWKGIIEELFDDFLHFFFPKFVHEVDFTKPSSCKEFYSFPHTTTHFIEPQKKQRNTKGYFIGNQLITKNLCDFSRGFPEVSGHSGTQRDTAGQVVVQILILYSGMSFPFNSERIPEVSVESLLKKD
jgi:hypothetical protein